MVLLGDGLYRLKVAAGVTPNALYGGDQNCVVAQKTEADIEQRFVMAVFE
jgi:hypothetical protein